MSKKKIGPLILILAIAGAAWWIYHSQSGGLQKFDLNPYHSLGAGVAEETAKLVGNKGQVVVVAPATSEFKNPVVEGELNSFQQTLKKSGMTIAATVRFKLTRLERMGTGGAVPRDQLLNVLQNHPGVGAVVLFAGFPQLAPQDYDALKSRSTKFVVASAYMPSYRSLLEARVIHLAIVPQFDRSPTAANPQKSLREWFESEFVVITPDSTTNLPY